MINCCLGASALGAMDSCFGMLGSLIGCLNEPLVILRELTGNYRLVEAREIEGKIRFFSKEERR